MDLEMEAVTSGSSAVLTLTGDLDARAAARVRRALDKLIKAGTSRVVVDMIGVRWLDSIGAGAFMPALSSLKRVGGTLSVRTIEGGIRRTLETFGLSEILRPAAV